MALGQATRLYVLLHQRQQVRQVGERDTRRSQRRSCAPHSAWTAAQLNDALASNVNACRGQAIVGAINFCQDQRGLPRRSRRTSCVIEVVRQHQGCVPHNRASLVGQLVRLCDAKLAPLHLHFPPHAAHWEAVGLPDRPDAAYGAAAFFTSTAATLCQRSAKQLQGITALNYLMAYMLMQAYISVLHA